jgi:hypothetical protein
LLLNANNGSRAKSCSKMLSPCELKDFEFMGRGGRRLAVYS